MESLSMYRNRWWNLSLGVVALMSFTVALSGCNGFFVCQGKASCPSSGTTSSSSDFLFATNSSSGGTYVTAYEVSSGSFVTGTGSPVSLGYTPQSIVVSQNNNNAYLYIASQVVSGATTAANIYGWSIGSGGALTALNSLPLVAETALAIDVSPDGQWLFALNNNWTNLDQFKIGSGGTLTFVQAYQTGFQANVSPFTNESTAGSVKVAPSGQFVAAQVAGQGTSIFPLTTSNGTVGQAQALMETSTIGNYALAIDSKNFVYVVMGSTTVASTTGLYVYNVNSSGVPNPATPLNSSSGAYPIGTPGVPSAMTIDTTNSYLYVATGASVSMPLIYGFTGVGTGTLTAMSPATVTAPPGVGAIGRDSDGTYVVAEGSSTVSGLQLYSIGTGGVLKEVTNVQNGGNSVPLTIAFTH